jgi:hypothetical protein
MPCTSPSYIVNSKFILVSQFSLLHEINEIVCLWLKKGNEKVLAISGNSGLFIFFTRQNVFSSIFLIKVLAISGNSGHFLKRGENVRPQTIFFYGFLNLYQV